MKTISTPLLALLIACQSTPSAPAEPRGSEVKAPPAPQPAVPATDPPPPATAPTGALALTTWDGDGRIYSGEPLPGRGGMYRYLFCPNGTYQRWCLDAACDGGTYTRDGKSIKLSSRNPDAAGKDSTLTLSADERQLDDGLGTGTLTFSGPAKQAAVCG